MVAREAPARLVLLGHPVSHSLSPRFQNAALGACGFAQRYDAIDVTADQLHAVIATLRTDRAGGNVTIPHKERVFALASRRSEIAERVGAVNTFWFDDGELVGHNTDVVGVHASVLSLLPNGIEGATCALFGAGGSAAAALVALESLRCGEIRLWTRTRSRGEELAARTDVRVTMCSSPGEAVRDAALAVNATPIGLHDDAMVVEPASLPPFAAALDLVYRRGETAWVRACRERGMQSRDGLQMLVEQGAAAFSCWFGMRAPREAMWNALRDVPAAGDQ